MGFASAWLHERALFPAFIPEEPELNTGIIIVVPAYNEPGITTLLDSLASCDVPACGVEVIIVVNAPPDAPDEYILNNRTTVENITSWKKWNKGSFFRLFYICPGAPEGWGVGMARKTGMDEALRRFDLTGNSEGVILNLDADCTVHVNYLTEVCNSLYMRKNRKACSIYFEHPLIQDSRHSDDTTQWIILYELHLRYYLQALMLTGFPYVFHTMGSAMAVKALPYMKAGGMNRKQAGEDFYLIQKLVSQGGYFYLSSTTVFPSPRTSFRVPFGTGAAMEKLSKENTGTLTTYDLKAFIELKSYFSGLNNIYLSSKKDLSCLYNGLPAGIKLFAGEEEWIEKISEIKAHTSGAESFRKRFFEWFNMFRIVKFLNTVHRDHYEKIPVEIAAHNLLEMKGTGNISATAEGLLRIYRTMEKTC